VIRLGESLFGLEKDVENRLHTRSYLARVQLYGAGCSRTSIQHARYIYFCIVHTLIKLTYAQTDACTLRLVHNPIVCSAYKHLERSLVSITDVHKLTLVSIGVRTC
jgi:hypothetical protein